MLVVGLDVGSTTVKASVCEGDKVLWQDYKRHNTKQAEMVLEFLGRIEAECGFTAGRDRIFLTGSGAGLIGPLLGGKMVQEVVAVSAAVEKLHPDVNFVSEIGGEDMKTLFFTPSGDGKSKQVYMQSACSGGTGTFVEKTARKLQVSSEQLAQAGYDGYNLHKISSKCGIFAEADSNTLVKSGVPVDEIIASLFEAVVYQNLATLTKGNTPMPGVLLLGGPNLFFKGLQEAWRHHLGKLWKERKVDADPATAIMVPKEAVYYACLGCVEIASGEPGVGVYSGKEKLGYWIEKGQWEAKAKEGAKGLVKDKDDLSGFMQAYSVDQKSENRKSIEPVLVGCDFGSTTAKAVVLSTERELLFSCYAPSNGNPIEDAKALFRQLRSAGFEKIAALALTGYGKDLLKDVIGADMGIVETVAHATAALHFFPDADVICDVGGTDVKIMILRQGTVADFRLNSQCSSGNGAFLQGVAERYNIPLEQYAEHAFEAKAMPALAMGCGVFLQSDIVNQQRKGWSADEIMAALAAVLPVNVWIYAGQLQNLRAAGRKFILQGGTHRNMAVVKAQVDFIRGKVPDADVVVHPYSGEAGAIGAALCAADWRQGGAPSRFRGFDTVEALTYTSTTSAETVCKWCPINCTRTFIDVQLPDARGRAWSKIPLAPGWERVISGNSCPKGLVEDANELRQVKAKLEEVKREYPNVAEMVRKDAFRRPRAESGAVAG
jgi:predicted CoA-substrate-specific enzyme activase